MPPTIGRASVVVAVAELDGREITIQRATRATFRALRELKTKTADDADAQTEALFEAARIFCPDLTDADLDRLTFSSAQRISYLACAEIEELERLLGEGSAPGATAPESS